MKRFSLDRFVEVLREQGVEEKEIAYSIEMWGLEVVGKTREEILNLGLRCNADWLVEDGYREKIGEPVKEYIPTCKFGFQNCIGDPAYLERYHARWFETMKREGREGCDGCSDGSWYDDEDK